MICYSTPTSSDVEMSSSRKGNHSSITSASTTYYDRNHEEDWCKVVTSQPDGSHVAQHAPDEPPSYMGLSVVVVVCFNLPLGLLAVLLAVRSGRDFQRGRATAARVQGKLSLLCSVLGITSTMTAVFLVIFWPAIVPDKG